MASQKEKPHQHVAGTCMGMCPNAEVRLRQREKMIHALEMAVDFNGRRLNYPQPRAMVKMFSRPAAGQEVKASDVRPVPVLLKTVRYLLANVCCVKDLPWALVYQFVYDRLQAIRQDLCVQGVRNSMALQIYQAAARFYVYAHYRTCEHDLKDFDPYLNLKQLGETLSTVMSLYQELDSGNTIAESDRANLEAYIYDDQYEESDDDSDVDSRGDEGAETKIVQDTKASEKDASAKTESSGENDDGKTDSQTSEDGVAESDNAEENERVSPSRVKDTRCSSNSGSVISCSSSREEAAALYLLVNLGNEEAIMSVLSLPQNVKGTKLVGLALRMNMAWLTHNYYRVLKLSTLLPPLFQCAFHPHMTSIQRKSLGIINQSHSCKGQSYCLEELSEALLYDSADGLAEACAHYGLAVKDGGIVFTKGTISWDAPLMKASHSKRIEGHLASVPLPELLLPTLT
ncbi:uncharacterized protein LOC127003580 isoform X1 [Eriocheir sinensis]|uniref:uncharacterized protein LOC127003580 isoform X1 n=2 Tax=Eriocheir sinensis TaxID=95602 RepID=UPI0021CAD1BE|nr:uncharacterized protein LOC127003580 isoform X1 [Eriocheir sinensis]XP_050726437.1 uncharacterized protein LOC127003580 isoform X1 [Eriocheir sinensis]XP_050726438.1 uncharacterized protein LOC127003580 isoform X1 [Eriocheir sinensis]XP_050726441.1 uncharacterized protein LOC127003580 isoform X1 [Eriocheir sinensis]